LPFNFLTLNIHVFDAVELAPGVDPEALEVAKDCLESIFSVNSTATGDAIQPGLLFELFASLEANERDQARAALLSQSVSNKPSQTAELLIHTVLLLFPNIIL
jgi:small glutamine-rich tetratricopeptide repeat-containing protein alpha